MAPQYVYKVRDRAGQPFTGSFEAPSWQDVVERLLASDYFIVDIREKPRRLWEIDIREIDFKQYLQPRVKTKELALFCRQLATLLNTGVPLLTGLQLQAQQLPNSTLRETVRGVIHELEAGRTLAESLGKFPRVFPPLFVHMVEAGEVGGVLDSVLERLASHYEKEYDLNEKVKSAMTYPAIVLVVALLAIGFMTGFVLPTFATMLTGLGTALPLPTRLVLGFSRLVQQYWLPLLGLIAGVVLAGYRYSRSQRGQARWDELILRLPVLGQLQQKLLVSRFTRTLGTLLRSGVPILPALEVVRRTTGNKTVDRAIQAAQENVRDGFGIAEPLASCWVFPPLAIQMIKVGEESGELDALLERISDFYDREVDALASRLASMIEPLLIVGLGGIIGFMIISLLLPMFNLIGAVK
ncbi:MAG: type II secretion system F family protein [Firmicutes bacterium]|nr:type II secretion system F family protein [Bacillota bacterium]